MDIGRTKDYYKRLSRRDLCGCVYCRNFIREVKSAYPEVADRLSGVGVDIEKPFETIPLEPDETGHVDYIAQYVLCGDPGGFEEMAMGPVHARIAESHPIVQLSEPYFVIEIAPIRLRWAEGY